MEKVDLIKVGYYQNVDHNFIEATERKVRILVIVNEKSAGFGNKLNLWSEGIDCRFAQEGGERSCQEEWKTCRKRNA